MAIRRAFTDPDTGEFSANAHHVMQNPVMRAETAQVVVVVLVYASKADYDAKKKPIQRYERTFQQAQYDALRQTILDLAEPFLIANFFPGGVRVAD